MCGRFLQFWFDEDILQNLGVDGAPPHFTPSYNIAPTQKAWVILHDKAPRMEAFSWGLVPSWATDIKGGSRLINARSETAAEKPSFRSAYTTRRCLVPANGFYEWTGIKSIKQPYYCATHPKAMMLFAGLWETWKGKDHDPSEKPYYSFTILTRESGPSFASIHHRMPVILAPEAYALWLAPGVHAAQNMADLLNNHYQDVAFTYPVSKAVNSPAYNTPECLERMNPCSGDTPTQQSLF